MCFFCKRPLFIDDYYTTFNKEHVTLVDVPGGVVSVDETGLTIARGEHYEVDVIIYATGFHNGFMPFPVIGRDGETLADIERRTIEDALAGCGGNVSEVSRRLGIPRRSLYRRLKQYGLK